MNRESASSAEQWPMLQIPTIREQHFWHTGGCLVTLSALVSWGQNKMPLRLKDTKISSGLVFITSVYHPLLHTKMMPRHQIAVKNIYKYKQKAKKTRKK